MVTAGGSTATPAARLGSVADSALVLGVSRGTCRLGRDPASIETEEAHTSLYTYPWREITSTFIRRT
jgi:hypothetical protein